MHPRPPHRPVAACAADLKRTIAERAVAAAVRDTSTDGVNVADFLKTEANEVWAARELEARRKQRQLLDDQIARDGKVVTAPRVREGLFGSLERGAVSVSCTHCHGNFRHRP